MSMASPTTTCDSFQSRPSTVSGRSVAVARTTSDGQDKRFPADAWTTEPLRESGEARFVNLLSLSCRLVTGRSTPDPLARG